jgi:thiamine-phosphate pyrophosphorylase
VSFTFPKIYPITNRRLSGLSHAEQLRCLAEGGATLVQLREKHLPSGEFLREATDAVRAARELGVTVLINDRVDIALAVGADGVHLGQDDLPPAEARRLLGDTAIIGFSTHTVGQAVAAARLPVNYIAYGPIFATETKKDTEPVVALEGLRSVRERIGTFPLVAIGGIDDKNLPEVFAAGADSAAVIGTLYTSFGQIAERMRDLLDTVPLLL